METELDWVFSSLEQFFGSFPWYDLFVKFLFAKPNT